MKKGMTTIFFLAAFSISFLADAAKTDVSVKFKVDSDWKDGFTATMTLTNNGDTTLADWAVEFDFPYNITQIWSAKIGSRTGNHYRIINEFWNGEIKPNTSVSFGFMGEPGKVKSPDNIAVYSGVDSGNVVLVYKSLVNAYRHSKVGNAWKYDGDARTERQVLVMEYDPAKKVFTDNALRFTYADGKMTREILNPFVEYEKEIAEGQSPGSYVVGSMFDVKNAQSGYGDILYGNIFTEKPVDIGWKEAIPVAKSMKGKINAETADEWKNYVVTSRIDYGYTRKANTDNMSFDEVADWVESDLKKAGYK